jgi:ribosomal protein S18 acetylase RimI-like enzyme
MKNPVIFNPKVHAHLIPSLAAIHIACIASPPYTMATFLPPLSSSRIEKWWTDRIAETASGDRKIIIQIATNPSTGDEELAGYVMLGMPSSETGPFRGTVEKLLVSPEHRRKGIARRLMESLETVARKEGRTLLVSHSGYISVQNRTDFGIVVAHGNGQSC